MSSSFHSVKRSYVRIRAQTRMSEEIANAVSYHSMSDCWRREEVDGQKYPALNLMFRIIIV